MMSLNTIYQCATVFNMIVHLKLKFQPFTTHHYDDGGFAAIS